MQTVESEITAALRQIRGGQGAAKDKLWALVYARLRRIAHHKLDREGQANLLSTTGLVHETYLKLADAQLDQIENRNHFYAIAARAMRQILVDMARRRQAQKRAPEQAAETDNEAVDLEPDEDVVAINNALEELAKLNPRLATVVECRFFGGFTNEQVAEALNVSSKTVEREWKRAKAYLKLILTDGPSSIEV